MTRLRRFCRFKYGDALPFEERVDGPVPVVSSGGIIARHDRANLGPGIVVGRKGSYGSLRWMGEASWVTDTAFGIDRSRTNTNLRYLYYLLHTLRLDEMSVDVGVPGLSRDDAYSREIGSPPSLDGQRRIANFLDHQVARLDEAKQETARLRSLLIERWGAWLDQALARSGEHVMLASLTDPARPIQYGIVLPGPHVEGGVPIVKGGDVGRSHLQLDSLSRTATEIEARYPRSRLIAGDLLIAIRGSVGEVARVSAELAGANITQDAARIAAARCDATWLRWVLQTPTVQSAIAARVTGATVRGINIGELRRVPIPAVDRHEQRRLGELAESRAKEHEAAFGGISASGGLLEERKRALITACVTGEFDVSTASTRAGDAALQGLR